MSAHSAVCAARRNQSDRLVIHQRLRCVKILLLNFGLERHAKHLCRSSFLYVLVPGNQISLYVFVYLFKVILSNSSPGFCSFFFFSLTLATFRFICNSVLRDKQINVRILNYL